MAAEEQRKQKKQDKILQQQVKRRKKEEAFNAKILEAEKWLKERERLRLEKRDEKHKLKQRRLEMKRARELKKPKEDMCLSDHKALPEFSRIPGLILPGQATSHCLMLIQFLRGFGKVLGLDLNADVPTLGMLQEGVLNVGDGMGQVQDLLVKMLSLAVWDPGLPPGKKTRTMLGDHLTNVGINRDNVSEVLQVYMGAHCANTELAPLALSLKTKAFQAHTPAQKTSILGFLANELVCSRAVLSEIDKSRDQMANMRKNKIIMERKLKKLRTIHGKRTGKGKASAGVEENQSVGTPPSSTKRKRKLNDSNDQDEVDQATSLGELEKQMEKLSKQHHQTRQKLFEISHSLHSKMYGQDRYRRRYWVLPHCGGVFIEAMESGEAPEELEEEPRRKRRKMTKVKVKEEPQEMDLQKEKRPSSSPAPSPSPPPSPALPLTPSAASASASPLSALQDHSLEASTAVSVSSKSESPLPRIEKSSAMPSPALEMPKCLDHLTPRPIPEEMLTGWWRVSDSEQLRALVNTLHSRGIREKALHRQIQKYMEIIPQVCTKHRDVAMIERHELEESQVTVESVRSWCVEEQAMEMDIAVLRQVEELERKVTAASLQVKQRWTNPDPQSEREDLVYYEHKTLTKTTPASDKDSKDSRKHPIKGGVIRHLDNPLDIAVTLLADLERNMERRGEEEVAHRMKVWREALGEVRSAAQLAMCIQQLQKSIAWKRSNMKVISKKGDNKDLLSQCAGCLKSHHTHCPTLKITSILEDNWYCPACISKESEPKDDPANGSRTQRKGAKGTSRKRKAEERSPRANQEGPTRVTRAKTARDNTPLAC